MTLVSDRTHIFVTDSRIDPNKLILEDIDVSDGPIFTISEVAKFFFARSAHWIRWREKKGHLSLDGEEVAGHRHDGTSSGARRYTLADVEKMAHAMASHDAINGAQLINTLVLVQTEAKVYGYI